MESRVRSTIDLEAAGKTAGTLLVPISTDESAYGAVSVPVVVIGDGDGPSVLITAAVHGDEFEGPVILRRLARELTPETTAGRLIILPYLNPPALRAGKRTSALDGLNLNRVFPGRADGGPTEQIAHFVTHELLPRVDVLVDLHSGGRSLLYAPLAATHLLGDAMRDQRAQEALKAFGAPIGLLATDLDRHGLLDHTAEAAGKMVISTELGGAGVFDPEAARIGYRGVYSLLHHLGVVPEPAEAPSETRLMQTSDASAFTSATAPGIYEPLVELLEPVEAGEAVGQIHSLEDCLSDPMPMIASASGMLICRRAQGLVVQGDCVAIVAQDVAA